jgi:hypothetical protein
VLQNGPTYSTSGGGSISFDGVDDHVDLGSANIVGNGPFSAVTQSNFLNTWACIHVSFHLKGGDWSNAANFE